MSDTTIHFEQVYEEAEELAAKKLANTSSAQIIIDIKAELDSLNQYDAKTELSVDTRRLLKHRSLGAILFLLSGISQRENINTWLALKEENKFEAADVGALERVAFANSVPDYVEWNLKAPKRGNVDWGANSPRIIPVA